MFEKKNKEYILFKIHIKLSIFQIIPFFCSIKGCKGNKNLNERVTKNKKGKNYAPLPFSPRMKKFRPNKVFPK